MSKKEVKIAVFENEFNLLIDDFNIANYGFFDSNLKYDVFESSQKFGQTFDKIHDYDLSFIDVDLSKSSEYDGLTLIHKLLEVGYNTERMVILTGHSTIEEKSKSRNLPKLEILKKPIDVEELANMINKALKSISKNLSSK